MERGGNLARWRWRNHIGWRCCWWIGSEYLRGLYLNNPLQRTLRDVLAAANHITQNADDTSGVLGGMMLGVEPPPLMFSVKESA